MERTQLKFYPDGKVLGFDSISVIKTAEVLGYDVAAVLLLFKFIELGLFDAIKNTKEFETDGR